jgi:hypothetical protein
MTELLETKAIELAKGLYCLEWEELVIEHKTGEPDGPYANRGLCFAFVKHIKAMQNELLQYVCSGQGHTSTGAVEDMYLRLTKALERGLQQRSTTVKNMESVLSKKKEELERLTKLKESTRV